MEQRGHFLRLKNPISLQLTFTFEPLTHQSPQHFSTMVTEGWRSVRMNKKSMGPDLKVFKCSRSCNKENIPKINKIITITNRLLYMVLHRTKQTSFWSLWWWTLNFILVIVLYSEDKIINDLPPHYNDSHKRIKLLLQTHKSNFSENIFAIKQRKMNGQAM